MRSDEASDVTTGRRGEVAAGRPESWRSPLTALMPSAVLGVTLLVGYFVLPFTSRITTHTVLLLAAGLLAVGVLLVWQIQAIRTSPMPLARGLGTLTLSMPLFLVVFSLTYYLMGHESPGSWSERLSRLDALYFTLATFATVGYGDIAPASEATRAVVTVQMVGNLVIVGVLARVVVHAVREGLARKEPSRTWTEPDD